MSLPRPKEIFSSRFLVLVSWCSLASLLVLCLWDALGGFCEGPLIERLGGADWLLKGGFNWDAPCELVFFSNEVIDL